MPNLYPIFLSLAGKNCLIAGLGKVGCRKLEGLLRCDPASVLVLEKRKFEELSREAQNLLADPRVHFQNRSCQEDDLANRTLVFAATDDPDENRRIVLLCGKSSILCDTITDPSNGDFISPAVARSGSLAAAISTCGQSPHLARKWRHELEQWLEPRSRIAWLLGRLRPHILAAGGSQAGNAAIFRRLADSQLALWLEGRELDKCRHWLENELPSTDANVLDDILAEYRNAFP